MFNISLQTADIPLIWKFASITPIFKKDRPVILQTTVLFHSLVFASKLMEVGIKDTLLTHMYIVLVLLNNSQHGFLKNKSTTTHLLECCLDWNVALSSKKMQ
jgi:hypothetical protein